MKKAGAWVVEHSDIEALHVEGDTFEAFRQKVADATADLPVGEGKAQDVDIEIIAHASVCAHVAA